jgi:hypothetical protein
MASHRRLLVLLPLAITDIDLPDNETYREMWVQGLQETWATLVAMKKAMDDVTKNLE